MFFYEYFFLFLIFCKFSNNFICFFYFLFLTSLSFCFFLFSKLNGRMMENEKKKKEETEKLTLIYTSNDKNTLFLQKNIRFLKKTSKTLKGPNFRHSASVRIKNLSFTDFPSPTYFFIFLFLLIFSIFVSSSFFFSSFIFHNFFSEFAFFLLISLPFLSNLSFSFSFFSVKMWMPPHHRVSFNMIASGSASYVGKKTKVYTCYKKRFIFNK